MVRAGAFICMMFEDCFVVLNITYGRKIMLIVLVDCVGLSEQPTGREHKTAKNGWKLRKVKTFGSTTRSFLAKNG